MARPEDAVGRPQRRTGLLVRRPHRPDPRQMGGPAGGRRGTGRQGDPARRSGPVLLHGHRRHRRGRRPSVRRRPRLPESRSGHGLRRPRQRRDLPGRQRRRLRHEVLPPLPGLPGPHLRDTGQPRLVRGPRRLHARLLRRHASPPPEPAPRPLTRAWLRSLLWHRPRPHDGEHLGTARKLRSAPAQQAAQPGPYWAIDAGPVRVIGIDTGLLGTVDAEQGAWLREVSQGPRPKILVTGSPLYVDGERHPCPIEGAARSTTSCATPPTTTSRR